MKTPLLLLLLLLCYSCSENPTPDCNYIEDYYPLVYEAEVAFHSGEHQKAFELYQSAFNSCSPKSTPVTLELMNFTEVCALLGKEELAVKYLRKLISQGAEMKWIQQDPTFDRVLATEEGKQLVADADSLRWEYLAGLNLELRKEIQQMVILDQAYNSTEVDDSIYHLHDKRLAKIFEIYGYPNERVIGGWNVDKQSINPFILLLHSRDSIRQHYFVPKLREFVKKGSCPPHVLASVMDNTRFFDDLPQTHGTYGDYQMIPEEEVSRNRISVGLPSLEVQRTLDSLKGG